MTLLSSSKNAMQPMQTCAQDPALGVGLGTAPFDTE